MTNIRHLACQTIHKVLIQRCSLNAALEEKTSQLPEHSALLMELCYGTLRYFHQTSFIAQILVEKPLKDKYQDVQVLILMGLYQLIHLRIPPPVVIDETVRVARLLRKPWASKVINGVLRNFERNREGLLKKTENNLTAFYSHPEWMIRKLQQAYPEQWQSILMANNQKPPFSLRVNLNKISRMQYGEKLTQFLLNEKFVMSKINDTGITLEHSGDVTKFPGFYQGEFSVQDCAAQLASEFLKVNDNDRVLDACCAPGGKAMHLLESNSTIRLTALDHDKRRLRAVTENAERLLESHIRENNLRIICADAAKPEAWWDQQLFDAILLDAPCSATGVIRRHPDIKLLRSELDIDNLANMQLHLLENLWPLLKASGKLLYITCSILPEENDLVIEKFLNTHQDVFLVSLTALCGKPSKYGWQILPIEENVDGFYYCLLQKV